MPDLDRSARMGVLADKGARVLRLVAKETHMPTMADRIAGKLSAELTPEQLKVIDESHQHHGHAGWREGGETHFRVEIVSPAFAGKSRLERHRLVNAALSEELAGGVHALAIVARAPGEA